MLNIGKLSPGAAEYYVGEVATSAEDYYLGHGEAAGRWVGSLASRLGLSGQVRADEFHRLLEGRHPKTGEWILSARGSAGRAAMRRRCQVRAGQRGLFDGDGLDVARVAARLNLSSRHVRRLLASGERWSKSGSSSAPGACLVGERERGEGRLGQGAWRVPESEVARFEAERRVTKARPGYDLTLRPPKSVSVLWALGSTDQQVVIRRAHREAVDAVVDYYESQAVFARRGTKGRVKVMTNGLVAAAFDHRSSRAGDPLLHTHVVTANVTLTVEGRWLAIDGQPLYEHARSGGYLYQAHLRHALTRDAGVQWHPVVNGWAEVEGVPTEVVRAFSKRRNEIEELVAESGYTSAGAHQAATLATRKAKDYNVDAPTLLARWREEAKGLGFGEAEVSSCFGRAQVTDHSPDVVERLLDRLAGPQGLTYRASTFSRRDVVESLATSLGSAAGAREIGDLADRFLASPRVVVLQGAARGRNSDQVIGRDGQPTRTAGSARYSTPELLQVEAQVLRWADEGFGAAVPVAETDAVEAALAGRPELSAEQAAMVRAVCLSHEALQPVAGRPGAGKTYGTEVCVQAFLDSGVPVVGCALSATAAAELEAATGLGRRTGRPATTIARLLNELDDPQTGGFVRGTVLIVDEASMVGSRDLARLGAHLAKAAGAMKLVGDPDQHGPVEAGGMFRRLVVARGDGVVSLVENNRQVDALERLAIEEYRQGRVAEALARYDSAGQVVRSATAGQSYDAMVADWYVDRIRGSIDPMVAGPNSTRRALNDRARVLLKAEGALTGPPLVVGGREFMVGDSVVARKNDRRLRRKGSTGFVKNGSAGTVVKVDIDAGELEVEFTSEGIVRLPKRYLDAGWVEHGYARTTYGVQGATLNRGHYQPSDASSFEEGYVALTRARCQTRIYVVDGQAAPNDEFGHGGSEIEATGLETVGAALEQRGSKSLASEADPSASARHHLFAGWDLRSLRLERERLENLMSACPPPVDGALKAISAERESLLTARRLWAEGQGHPPGGRTDGRLAGLDRRLAATDERMLDLSGLQWERDGFLADHADHRQRLDLVRLAESARELKVRTEAGVCPPALVRRLLGTGEPHEQHHSERVEAAQEVAVYLERYGEGTAHDPLSCESDGLGARPTSAAASRAFDPALGAMERAVLVGQPDVTQPDMLEA